MIIKDCVDEDSSDVPQIQSPSNVQTAYDRIKSYLDKTPILKSDMLNHMLGADIYFKADALQKTGAFKVRGVLNNLLILKEQGCLPKKIVGYSTGNHGIGLAWVAQKLGIKARIYLPKNTTTLKQKMIELHGADVVYTDSRVQAEELSRYDTTHGFHYIHPSDSDETIAGAGTCAFEALQQMGDVKPDAIFASCGGGGLLSGTYLAKELLSSKSKLIGSEPLNANDAFLSVKHGQIFRFFDSPNTIADGLRTLGISRRTFEYLKKLDEFYLVDEEKIDYWTKRLIYLLKINCEPSSAINMASVVQWLKCLRSQELVCESNNSKTCLCNIRGSFKRGYNGGKKLKILVIISGGNIDLASYNQTLT